VNTAYGRRSGAARSFKEVIRGVEKPVLARVGLDVLAVVAFLTVLAILNLVYGANGRLIEGSVVWPAVVVAVMVGGSLVSRARGLLVNDTGVRRDFVRRTSEIIRDWVPLIVLILVYENLYGFTGLIRPDSIEMELYRLDVALFGVEPTIWAQRFANPWLTEYCTFAYSLYFILPLSLGSALYVSGRREDFRELMTGILIIQYTGFLLYITFPAGPPRFAIPEMFEPAHLAGRFGFFEFVHGAFDGVNPDKVHASFPSLHCAISFAALLYARRFKKELGGVWTFWAFLPLAISLWCATVYLRHHWVVDCFAGIALGLVVFAVTPGLRRWHGALQGSP
jgi:membrane-associated phospholipid phosphatase